MRFDPPFILPIRGVTVEGALVELPTPISATGTLDIYGQMSLQPPLLYLPWDPVQGEFQRLITPN